MKYKRFLFISLLICIGFTIWQRNNLKTIWDEYSSLNESFHYIGKHWLPKTPAIRGDVAKRDPEAAAIANYKLNYIFFSKREQILNALSQNIHKFPDNQYFIYAIAEHSFHDSENGLDPAILIKLSNRLIELDPKNSAYYYLKAYALFCDRKNNNFDEVIKIINQAQKCEYYKEPYTIYKDRIVSIAQKQGLHDRLISELIFEFPYNYFIREIYEVLIHYQNLLITEGDLTKADEVSNVLNRMLKSNMYGLIHPSISFLHFPGGGFGYWCLPQQVELQRKNLTQNEADRKRLQICAIINPEKQIKEVFKYYSPNMESFYVIAVLPFMYIFRMAVVFMVLAAILMILSAFRKDNFNIDISKAVLARFLIYIFVYFLAGQFSIIIEFFVGCGGHFHCSYANIFFVPPFLHYISFEDIRDLFDAPLSFTLPFIIPSAIAFCMGILRFFKPKLDNCISRFISGTMISIPLGITTTILQGHTYLRYLPIIFFLFFAFKYSSRDIFLKNIFQVFTGNHDYKICALRTRLLSLSVIAFILCWLSFLLLTSPVEKSMQPEENRNGICTYSFTENYDKAYRDVLRKIDDVNAVFNEVITYIPLVKSDDLPGILQELKKREFPILGIPIGNKDYHSITDYQILGLLRFAGKDCLPGIFKFIDNPDNSWALIIRAQLGDKTVKDKLTNLLNEAIKNEDSEIKPLVYTGPKPRVFELISALAAISTPNQAYSLFSQYFKNYSAKQISNEFNFEYRKVCTLQKHTILKLLNLYLNKAEDEISSEVDYRRYNFLHFLRTFKGLYWDNETAKKTLSLILQASDNKNDHLETFGIEYYLTPEASDLLIKGLQSQNENLRAWCVWQFRKINYKWKENELRKIAEDKSWKVRANVSVIDKSLIKEDEPSDYIKFIKSM